MPKKTATTQLKEQEKAFKNDAAAFAKTLCAELTEKPQKFVVAKLCVGNNVGVLKNTIKAIQKAHAIPVCLVSNCDGKVSVAASSVKAVVGSLPANKWVTAIVSIANGKGGGKPDAAQGVCTDVSDENLQAMLTAGNDFASGALP